MNSPQNSPLTARLYDLEYPRSLGVYSTYAEVQTVVDALADKQFPVQHTMIVGTDLKLIERVTGRKSWGKVIRNGIFSGLWMGLFMGLLFVLITDQSLLLLLTTVLMGIVFFTVWAAIGYASTGGKRDFTSMTATIPMQYELMVEHTHAHAAREILQQEGTATPPAGMHRPEALQHSRSAAPGTMPQNPTLSPTHPASPPQATEPPAPSETDAPRRPSYGQPAAPQRVEGSPAPASPRRSFGQPADGSHPGPVEDTDSSR